MTKTHLRGITWNHSRGYVSVVATAQRFCELHPQVAISWDKRSLQEFARRAYPEPWLSATICWSLTIPGRAMPRTVAF